MPIQDPVPRIEIDMVELQEPAQRDYHIPRLSEPVAYIITSNRGRRYLAFAGSVEHQNAVMFGYEMKPMMNDDGLLECPFCGSNEAYKDNGDIGYYVACPQCGCGTDGRFKLSERSATTLLI
jgi:hypothetical protein